MAGFLAYLLTTNTGFIYAPGIITHIDFISALIVTFVMGILFSRNKQAFEKYKLQSIESNKTAQAESELRQAVMILAGSIVHDLRTPIAVINMKGSIIQKYWPILIDAYSKAKIAQLPLRTNLEEEGLEIHKKIIAKTGNDLNEISQQMDEFVNTTLKTLSKVLKHVSVVLTKLYQKNAAIFLYAY